MLEPTHEAVVSLAARLDDASRVALFDRSFVARRPVEGDTPEAVARALGEALSEVVAEVGAAVVGALGEAPRAAGPVGSATRDRPIP